MTVTATKHTINWDHYQVSLIAGAIILPISICAYCSFLFNLKRDTPLIWPYATRLVTKSTFQLEPFFDPYNRENLPELNLRQWVLTLGNEKYYLSTQDEPRKNVYLVPPEKGNTTTLVDPGFHQSTIYEGATPLKLDKNQTLLLGGIEEPLTTMEYKKYDLSYATKLTWLWQDSQLKPGPSMSFPRAYPHLLYLANGNTLVTGGVRAQIPLEPEFSTTATPAIEEYAQKENRFIPQGQMQIPRYQHSVCQLRNGNFLIVSGRTNHYTSDSKEDLTSSIEIYSPKTQKSWIVGQLHNAMTEPILTPLKGGEVAINDRQSLIHSDFSGKPYLEIFTGTQEPVKKLPHLWSIAEMLHSLRFWRQWY